MTDYSRAYFQDLDQQDELSSCRDQFFIPDDMIYLDGNSLGAMPVRAAEIAENVIKNQWGNDLITSWNKHDWFTMGERLGNKIAPLIGAEEGETLVCDATGINLFKILSMALDLNSDRKKIIMEGSNFPTDNYIAQGLIQLRNQSHRIQFVEYDEIDQAITEEVAVICLTHTHYKTGYIHDMKAITQKAHEKGALIIWDLCHSAGAIPIDLNDCNADFAVGCGYKYLNGGPGAPAFVYVANRHQGSATQPLYGWWGHAEPFAFERDYRPADNIWQMQTGSQPILSMAVMEAGLDIFTGLDMEKVREKSLGLSGHFIYLVEKYCGEYGVKLVSPRENHLRGSQVSFAHPDGYAVMQALIAHNVIGDFRAPDAMRFGFTPLYTRYVDIWDAVQILHNILKTEEWQKAEYHQRNTVT